jgi:HEAT repeat protein
VRQAIKDPDLDVRYAAVLSLIELAEEDCFAEVAALIHAAHGPPREQVLRAFFHAINYLQLNVATSAAVEDLLQALEVALADDQPGARVAAAMPLITMGHERATAILRQGYYREPDPEAKARMMSVAVLLSSPAGDEFLQDGLQSAERHVRETAEDLAEYLTHSGGET